MVDENPSGAPEVSAQDKLFATPPDKTPNADASKPSEPVSEEEAPIIWDENNKLVDRELDEHFKTEAGKVLGTIDKDGNKTEEGAPIYAFESEFDSPKEYQASEGATSEPMTSPKPSSDPNQRPSKIGAE